MTDSEIFMTEMYDEGLVTEVIRPAAIVPEESARAILMELALRDVQLGGHWLADPSRWARYDAPWVADGDPVPSELIGTIQVAYGTPSRYEITIYRVTVTAHGTALGYNVSSLCDEALAFGGLSLTTCPRATFSAPPKPFHF